MATDGHKHVRERRTWRCDPTCDQVQQPSQLYISRNDPSTFCTFILIFVNKITINETNLQITTRLERIRTFEGRGERIEHWNEGLRWGDIFSTFEGQRRRFGIFNTTSGDLQVYFYTNSAKTYMLEP